MNEETVTIPRKEYQQLLDTEFWMNCLEAAGIDNWEGIDLAIDIRNEGDQ